MWANIALVVGAYLLGALPLAQGIGRLYGLRLAEGEDIHLALWRKVGRLQGAAGVGSDVAKGIVPVVLGKGLGFEIEVVALAGVMAVVGQMWPVFLRFDGEKGNTTGLAVIVFLIPWQPLLVALAPIVAGVLVRTVPRVLSRGQSMNERLKLGGPPSFSLPLGMAVGFGVLPLSAWAFRLPTGVVLACLGLFILIILRRLTANLGPDLKAASSKSSVLINRIFFDRSFR